MLTLRTDDGDFVLDNRRNEIRRWNDLDYVYLKRQSEGDPRAMGVALGRRAGRHRQSRREARGSPETLNRRDKARSESPHHSPPDRAQEPAQPPPCAGSAHFSSVCAVFLRILMRRLRIARNVKVLYLRDRQFMR